MQAAGHEVQHRKIPTVESIFILKFGADVGDALLGRDEIDGTGPEGVGADFTARRCRPHIRAEQFEKLRLAGAVAANERPTLPGIQAQRYVPQGPRVAPPHADGVQLDVQPVAHERLSRQIPLSSATRPSRSSVAGPSSDIFARTFSSRPRRCARNSASMRLPRGRIAPCPGAMRSKSQASSFLSDSM